MTYCYFGVKASWYGHGKQSNVDGLTVNPSITFEAAAGVNVTNTQLSKGLCWIHRGCPHIRSVCPLSCQVKIINAAREISRQRNKKVASPAPLKGFPHLPPQRCSISRFRGYFRTREWSSALAGRGQIYPRL